MRPASDCSGGAEAELDGPLVADLLGDGLIGGPQELDLDSDRFCRFEATFAKVDDEELPAGAPAALADQSILVRGALDDGTPFQIASDIGDTLRLEPAEGDDFAVAPSTDCLLVALDPLSWLDDVYIEGAEHDGTIFIDDDENDDLLDAFEDAFKDSIDLRSAEGGGCVAGPVLAEGT